MLRLLALVAVSIALGCDDGYSASDEYNWLILRDWCAQKRARGDFSDPGNNCRASFVHDSQMVAPRDRSRPQLKCRTVHFGAQSVTKCD